MSQIVCLIVSDSVVTETPQAVTVSVSDTVSAETLTLAEVSQSLRVSFTDTPQAGTGAYCLLIAYVSYALK